jgi:hypothetical protein
VKISENAGGPIAITATSLNYFSLIKVINKKNYLSLFVELFKDGYQ